VGGNLCLTHTPPLALALFGLDSSINPLCIFSPALGEAELLARIDFLGDSGSMLAITQHYFLGYEVLYGSPPLTRFY
jgi:hypothetical protein